MKYWLILLLIFPLFYCSESNEKSQDENNKWPKIMWVRAKGGLRLRSEPNLTAPRIATIPNEEKVNVISEHGSPTVLEGRMGTWVSLNWSGHNGFAFDGFLTPYEPKRPPQPPRKAASAPSPDTIKIVTKIESLTGISIPEEEKIYFSRETLERRANLAVDVGLGEKKDFDRLITDLEIYKTKRNSRYTVFTISPDGKECNFYGITNCINIIAKNSGEFVFSDLENGELGGISKINEHCATFEIIKAEGDGCQSFGKGETSAFFFKSSKVVTKDWVTSEECQCPCNFENECSCHMKRDEKVRYISGGFEVNPTEEEHLCFRQLGINHKRY